ncbi:hypothetical protein GNF76_02835 [Pseudomonas sp. CCM 7893]|uniref:Uncharacterized protein n=1 Tax=Pseudomonas spelaei TaxID=1055469 RepID=A0A6I3W6V5_9PSED|nr:hypothetical protein [Pseudomonas spelaei]MUF03253.1 hypothetical protein [Pseudomonas spelaei]QLG91547.1 hypothetical protein HZF02_06060 [Pseudomonas yamanorum]
MLEHTKEQAELEKVHVEIKKLVAEQRKYNAEVGKISREIFWYPVGIVLAMIATISTATALLIKLIT